MTEPGWYNAEGDPVGTQRYWDGTVWIGEPVYEPAATPGPTMYPPQAAVPPPVPGAPAPPYPSPAAGGYTYSQPPAKAFPGHLKVLTIIVSVLKAIPFALGVFVLFLVAALARDFDNSETIDDWDFGGLFEAAIAVMAVVLLIGGVLLVTQFVGALKEKPIMVFVPAVIMSILDALFTLGAWGNYFENQGTFGEPSPGGPVLMTAVTAAQIAVAVMAIKANSATKA